MLVSDLVAKKAREAQGFESLRLKGLGVPKIMQSQTPMVRSADRAMDCSSPHAIRSEADCHTYETARVARQMTESHFVFG